jgi:hypothetical protein
MKLRRSYKTDGWLFGWRTGSNYQPNAALWNDARARRFCKDKGRKAATAKQELQKITAGRALIRRISGIKSSRISKDRCEATCQVTKPKTNIMSDYISHDDEHDGIDRRGFLQCMAWAGTGLLWTISGHLISEQQLNLNLN